MSPACHSDTAASGQRNASVSMSDMPNAAMARNPNNSPVLHICEIVRIVLKPRTYMIFISHQKRESGAPHPPAIKFNHMVPYCRKMGMRINAGKMRRFTCATSFLSNINSLYTSLPANFKIKSDAVHSTNVTKKANRTNSMTES